MKEHRSARLWMAFAAVAAIGLLLVGPRLYRQSEASRAPGSSPDDTADAPLGDKRAGSTVGRAVGAPPENDAVGTPASADPDQQVDPDQAARALLRKRLEAAQFSPHRLEWEPEEVSLSNSVLDLCDDEQAGQAGLSTVTPDDSRHNLGIDCRTSERRFGYILPHEELRFANSYEEADALLQEFAEKRTIKGEHFPKRPGSLMGNSGSSPLEMGLDGPCGTGFGCNRATIDVSRGTTRGLFTNASDEVAHNVTITAGNVSAHHPLSVQPGEVTAFELPAELTADQLATLSITATFVAGADPRRAVRMIGAPGEVEGPPDEVSRRCFHVELPRDQPVIRYYMEGVLLEDPNSHPGALPDKVLQAPIAVAALLDQRSKVVGVLRLPVTLSTTDRRPPVPVTAMSNELHNIGFVMPPEVTHSIISVGGAE